MKRDNQDTHRILDIYFSSRKMSDIVKNDSIKRTSVGDEKGINNKQQMNNIEYYRAILHERDDKIELLEKEKSRQEIMLMEVKEELHKMRIKTREDTYLFRLEVEKHLIEKKAAENRIRALEEETIEKFISSNNLKKNEDIEVPQNIDKEYVIKLHSHLTKSLRVISVLDNQISLIKKSCADVIKSLKLEMGQIMEERSKVELDLLNQLASLELSKRQKEDEYRRQIHSLEQLNGKLEAEYDDFKKSESMNTAEKENGPNTDIDPEVDPLDSSNSNLQSDDVIPSAQYQVLTEEMNEMKLEYENEVTQHQEKILELETVKNSLKYTTLTLEQKVKDLENSNVFETEKVLHKLQMDSDDAIENLERVEECLRVSDDAIQKLNQDIQIIQHHRKTVESASSNNSSSEHVQTMSFTLDKTLLVHEQIKVSLLLVELKLKNQLSAISEGKVLPEFAKKILLKSVVSQNKSRQLQKNALKLIQDIESDTSEKILALQNEKDKRIDELEKIVGVRENQIIKLETTMAEKARNQEIISANVMSKLQDEVFSTVERIKHKNITIQELSLSIKEHKAIENSLRKELMKTKRQMQLMENNETFSAWEESTLLNFS